MNGFDESRGTLSVTFYPGVSADNMTTLSTSGMIVGRRVLNNRAKMLLLDKRQFLEAMRQILVEGGVDWIQQHILFRLIV